jgi:hypothetical protein
MIEVYVYLEGAHPKEVILGRRHAVDRLLVGGFSTTPAERRRISVFLEGAPCDLGTGLHLVGFPPDVPDRKIVRVVGPGSLV